MNDELKPGKGAHLVVNAEMLGFVRDTVQDIQEAYDEAGGDPTYDELPKKFFQTICKTLLSAQRGEDTLIAERAYLAEWEVASDKFGDKLIAWTRYPDGECRVTLILTKPKGSKGPELKLDIRPWIEY
jgi:hypothetical protein